MTTPNDGTTAPAGFPDMQQNSTQNPNGTNATPNGANASANGNSSNVNITGDESAADLEAEKKEIQDDDARVEAFKKQLEERRKIEKEMKEKEKAILKIK